MWATFPQFDHGSLQGQRLGEALLQASVERNHELFGAAVVNVPQTEDERLRSGLEQAANQSDHLVPWPYHIQTGCAATQNDQFDREL